MRRDISILEEPVGLTYRGVLEVAAQYCSNALLVVRDNAFLRGEANEILFRLRRYEVEVRKQDRWPGTILIDDMAIIYSYLFTGDVRNILADAVEGLYDWLHPQRPEDLCLLRSDGSAWITSIAHERDAYFTISKQEREILVSSVPHLKLSDWPVS